LAFGVTVTTEDSYFVLDERQAPPTQKVDLLLEVSVGRSLYITVGHLSSC